jgi:predicted DNA-binding antitoxin AbrB/MazE fold protein
MSQEIRAIFENGLFRPLDPVSLGEQAVVSLVVGQPKPSATGVDEQTLARQQDALREMFDEADSLPLERSDGGFSGADHDQVLYGSPK